ncbi:MAG: hypothetical protein ACRD38_03400 [Nitrososphaerales archaeon]
MNQTERLNKKPKYSAIALGIVLATAFVLVQPTMQASYAQVADLGAPAFYDCDFDTDEQASDPLSMNTVRVNDVAKTIIVEKEIFQCRTVQGDIDLLVHVDTIAEIFENMTNKEIIRKQTEVVTCVLLDPSGQDSQENNDGSVLGCDVYTPGTDFVPVSDCRELTGIDDYLEHPQEMNTVNKGKTVKTIIAQKEVFYCDFGPSNTQGNTQEQGEEFDDDKKIEQYVITEIWENLNSLPNNPVTQKNVESLRCTTLIEQAFVESCAFETEPVQELE